MTSIISASSYDWKILNATTTGGRMIKKVCQFAERLPQSLNLFFSPAVRLRNLPIDLGKLDLIRLIALGKFVKGKTLQVRSDLLGLTAIEEPWRTVAKITANLMASTAK